MCTVSVIPIDNAYRDGAYRSGAYRSGAYREDAYPDNAPHDDAPGPILRLAFSRDELRTRATALPPWTFSSGGFRSVMPVDPDSAGTWIAANDRGVVFATMNVNPPRPRGGVPPTSRGHIIPSLLPCESAREARARVNRFSPRGYAPFRLLLLDRIELLEAVSDGVEMRWRSHDLGGPHMFTSSGLGDHRVDRPRRALFRSMFSEGPSDARTQDAFHRHAWPHAPALSVRMSRPDASTVSYTVVELAADAVTMRYQDLSTDSSADQTEFRLDVCVLCRT